MRDRRLVLSPIGWLCRQVSQVSEVVRPLYQRFLIHEHQMISTAHNLAMAAPVVFALAIWGLRRCRKQAAVAEAAAASPEGV